MEKHRDRQSLPSPLFAKSHCPSLFLLNGKEQSVPHIDDLLLRIREPETLKALPPSPPQKMLLHRSSSVYTPTSASNSPESLPWPDVAPWPEFAAPAETYIPSQYPGATRNSGHIATPVVPYQRRPSSTLPNLLLARTYSPPKIQFASIAPKDPTRRSVRILSPMDAPREVKDITWRTQPLSPDMANFNFGPSRPKTAGSAEPSFPRVDTTLPPQRTRSCSPSSRLEEPWGAGVARFGELTLDKPSTRTSRPPSTVRGEKRGKKFRTHVPTLSEEIESMLNDEDLAVATPDLVVSEAGNECHECGQRSEIPVETSTVHQNEAGVDGEDVLSPAYHDNLVNEYRDLVRTSYFHDDVVPKEVVEEHSLRYVPQPLFSNNTSPTDARAPEQRLPPVEPHPVVAPKAEKKAHRRKTSISSTPGRKSHSRTTSTEGGDSAFEALRKQSALKQQKNKRHLGIDKPARAPLTLHLPSTVASPESPKTKGKKKVAPSETADSPASATQSRQPQHSRDPSGSSAKTTTSTQSSNYAPSMELVGFTVRASQLSSGPATTSATAPRDSANSALRAPTTEIRIPVTPEPRPVAESHIPPPQLAPAAPLVEQQPKTPTDPTPSQHARHDSAEVAITSRYSMSSDEGSSGGLGGFRHSILSERWRRSRTVSPHRGGRASAANNGNNAHWHNRTSSNSFTRGWNHLVVPGFGEEKRLSRREVERELRRREMKKSIRFVGEADPVRDVEFAGGKDDLEATGWKRDVDVPGGRRDGDFFAGGRRPTFAGDWVEG